MQKFPLNRSNNNLFVIYNSNNGFIIDASKKLLPNLRNIPTISIVNGLFFYRFNMNTRYTDNQIVPIPPGRLTLGLDVALLSDESGKSEMIPGG